MIRKRGIKTIRISVMKKRHNYIMFSCDNCDDTSFYDYLLLKKNIYGKYLICGVCGKKKYIFETMVGELLNKDIKI